MNNEKVIYTEQIHKLCDKEIFKNGNYRIVEYFESVNKINRYKHVITYYDKNNNIFRKGNLPTYISYFSNGNIQYIHLLIKIINIID